MKVALRGPCSFYSGLGKVFRGLGTRLQGRMPMELLPVNNYIPDGYPLAMEMAPKAKYFGVVICHPPYLDQLATRYRILYTMYEHSDIPVEWQDFVSRANEVWVPSQFCLEVFSLHSKRVRVVPIGYDETAFSRDAGKEKSPEHFWSLYCPEVVGKRVVGTAGVLSKRKGVDVLCEAFRRAELEDTALVLKTRDTRGNLPPLPENTFVIDEDWPEETLAAFYRSLDLFVFPTRGEGLGLPPLEAAACGTPSLVTRASGPCEYIDDRGIYGIEVAGIAPSEGSAADNVNWYVPSLPDLVAKLKDMVYHPPKVEHRYRQHSLAHAADVWERELVAAKRRAVQWIRKS